MNPDNEATLRVEKAARKWVIYHYGANVKNESHTILVIVPDICDLL